jgi:hypothetical protein
MAAFPDYLGLIFPLALLLLSFFAALLIVIRRPR